MEALVQRNEKGIKNLGNKILPMENDKNPKLKESMYDKTAPKKRKETYKESRKL